MLSDLNLFLRRRQSIHRINVLKKTSRDGVLSKGEGKGQFF